MIKFRHTTIKADVIDPYTGRVTGTVEVEFMTVPKGGRATVRPVGSTTQRPATQYADSGRWYVSQA